MPGQIFTGRPVRFGKAPCLLLTLDIRDKVEALMSLRHSMSATVESKIPGCN